MLGKLHVNAILMHFIIKNGKKTVHHFHYLFLFRNAVFAVQFSVFYLRLK